MNQYGRKVRRVLWNVLLLNILVVVCKLIAGYLAGSLSVITDAIHSSTDAMNNVLGLVIIRIASAAPDADHPYGHQKFETLAAFAVAGLLSATAFQVVITAVKRIMGGETLKVEVSWLTLGVMIGTLAVNIFVWKYESSRARTLNSSFLEADSRHTFSDIVVTSSVLAGLLLVRVGYEVLDPLMALGVAAVIAYAAYGIFSSTIPVLVDSAPLSAEHIARIVRETPGVDSVHEIQSRGVPGKIFITMHLVVTPTDMLEAHAVTEDVEKNLEHAIGPCHITIHVEPEGHE